MCRLGDSYVPVANFLQLVADRKRGAFLAIVRRNVHRGSAVHTDEWFALH